MKVAEQSPYSQRKNQGTELGTKPQLALNPTQVWLNVIKKCANADIHTDLQFPHITCPSHQRSISFTEHCSKIQYFSFPFELTCRVWIFLFLISCHLIKNEARSFAAKVKHQANTAPPSRKVPQGKPNCFVVWGTKWQRTPSYPWQ